MGSGRGRLRVVMMRVIEEGWARGLGGGGIESLGEIEAGEVEREIGVGGIIGITIEAAGTTGIVEGMIGTAGGSISVKRTLTAEVKVDTITGGGSVGFCSRLMA